MFVSRIAQKITKGFPESFSKPSCNLTTFVTKCNLAELRGVWNWWQTVLPPGEYEKNGSINFLNIFAI